jgi:hypothetical protein
MSEERKTKITVKNKRKKLFRVFLILSSYLLVFGLGMYAYKNERIKNSILSVRNIKDFSISNYTAGRNANPPVLFLNIPDSAYQVIERSRELALDYGILKDEYKVTVDASMNNTIDTFNIEMRLKGDYKDHWEGDKWSYRIKIRQGKRYAGMKTFSIQDPSTRGWLNEWYFYKLLKNEDLIALNYKFVKIIENSKNKGLYAVEQSFDKRLLESNNRREAPILKFDESVLIDSTIINDGGSYSQENLYLMAKIDMFKTNKTLNNPILNDQYEKGEFLLKSLRSGDLPLSDCVDIEKAALLFAIADLVGGHHSLRWKNVRFYYNPLISKLEMIGFDSNSGSKIEDIYFNKWRNHRLGEFDVFKWKSRFFTDSIFVEHYFNSLEKISDPTYLQDLHERIKGEMELFLSYIYSENSMYDFKIDNYIANAEVIRTKLEEYKRSKSPEPNEYFVEIRSMSPLKIGDNQINLEILNKSFEAIIVHGVFDPEERLISENSDFIVKGRENNQSAKPIYVSFNLNSSLDSTNMTLKVNLNRWVHKKIKFGYSYLHQTTLPNYTKIEAFHPSSTTTNYLDDASFFRVNENLKLIEIGQGNWVVNKNIRTPKGYRILCSEGTSININKGATLSFNGPIEFIGSKEKRIKIYSTDSSGTVLIYQAKDTSRIEYVDFTGLSETHSEGVHLSGGLNFFESDVTIKNAVFSYNNSEDALNIVRSNFDLQGVKFISIYSDAFDSDFSTGHISHVNFKNIGNDALDFSGSKVLIDDVYISVVGDKGVSAGEKSSIIVSNVLIDSTELAFVSKDYSYLLIKRAEVLNSSVSCAVFTKKVAYGPARIVIQEYKASKIKEEFLLEYGSFLSVNSVKINSNYTDVPALLYGGQYGKSSK